MLLLSRSLLSWILWSSLVLPIGLATAQDEPDSTTVTASPPLKVAVREVPPFAFRDEADNWEGLSVELWEEVSRRIGRTFEYVEMPLKETIAAVDSGEVDTAIAALTITSEREQKFDFSHPYIISGLSVAYAGGTRSAWAATIRGFFSWDFLRTILTLSLLLLAVGAAVWYFERNANTDQFNNTPRKGLGDGFWWSAVTMTTVGYGDKAPATFGGRIVALFWMFASLILIATFTASIAASLTANQLEAEFLKDRQIADLTVGVIEGSAAQEVARGQGARLRAYPSLDAALEGVADDQVDVVLHDRPILLHAVKEREEDLQVADRIIVRDDYGFALPAGSELREEINTAMLSYLHEPGWERLRQRYLGDETSE